MLGRMIREAGIITALLLLDSATIVPDAGAAWDSPTVQVVLLPETRVLPHVNEVNVSGATSVMVAVAAEPLELAVTVAEPLEVI